MLNLWSLKWLLVCTDVIHPQEPQLKLYKFCLVILSQKTESSIIQTFVLPPGEKLVAMFQHSETVESVIIEDNHSDSSSGVLHTVDGMILVTTSGVFQCQPRTSPEKLFLELAVNSSDTSAADVLAITSGLDVNKLYEVGIPFKFHGKCQLTAENCLT